VLSGNDWGLSFRVITPDGIELSTEEVVEMFQVLPVWEDYSTGPSLVPEPDPPWVDWVCPP